MDGCTDTIASCAHLWTVSRISEVTPSSDRGDRRPTSRQRLSGLVLCLRAQAAAWTALNTDSQEVDSDPVGTQAMLAPQARPELLRNGKRDVSNCATHLADEVTMLLEVGVVTPQAPDRRYLVDLSLRDEHVQVAVHRPERKTRKVRLHRIEELGS